MSDSSKAETTAASIPTAREAEIAPKPATSAAAPKSSAGRKVAGKIISVLIVAAAVGLALYVWGIIEHYPRTDDATVRANVVGIVPRVRGLIVQLHVADNQEVKQGDLLFEIDPEDYELALDRAKAALTSLDQQIERARGEDAGLKFGVKAAEAGVERAQAQLKQAEDTLKRLQPLLPKGFARAGRGGATAQPGQGRHRHARYPDRAAPRRRGRSEDGGARVVLLQSHRAVSRPGD